MKSSTEFSRTIEAKLNEIASSDQLFAKTLKKEGKNLQDCITYILNTVQKSGCNGFTDDEIFNMAIHYYDEDGIDIGNPITCNVVVNHTVELTEEEILAEKDKAKQSVFNAEKERLLKKSYSTKVDTTTTQQPTLF